MLGQLNRLTIVHPFADVGMIAPIPYQLDLLLIAIGEAQEAHVVGIGLVGSVEFTADIFHNSESIDD